MLILVVISRIVAFRHSEALDLCSGKASKVPDFSRRPPFVASVESSRPTLAVGLREGCHCRCYYIIIGLKYDARDEIVVVSEERIIDCPCSSDDNDFAVYLVDVIPPELVLNGGTTLERGEPLVPFSSGEGDFC